MSAERNRRAQRLNEARAQLAFAARRAIKEVDRYGRASEDTCAAVEKARNAIRMAVEHLAEIDGTETLVRTS